MWVDLHLLAGGGTSAVRLKSMQYIIFTVKCYKLHLCPE